MASFADNVFQAFHALTAEYRFVPAAAGAGKRFAALVRQETAEVYVYVLVHDGRSSDSNLDVDLWVAPPESPDHSLETLHVGYKVRIASEYDIDDDFFLNCQRRIIQFLPCVSAIIPLVRQELANPSFQTRRWTVYHVERSALSTLLSMAEEGNSDAAAAVTAARQLASGKGSLETLEEVSMPIARMLIESKALHNDALAFFDGNVQSLASTFATHLYARALGEESRKSDGKGDRSS